MAVTAISLVILLSILASTYGTKKQCCRDRGVSSICADLFCDPNKPPGDTDIYTAFDEPRSCKKFLSDIAICIADGHDATNCCFDKAERQDLSGCFGMCKGSATGAVESWNKFQSCMAINLSPMFGCLTDAYKLSPSAPRNVRIISKTTTSVRLDWNEPAKNPSLVRSYKVIFTETSGRRHTETVHESRTTSISISNLLPEKKYTIYVVAQAAGNDDLSQASDFVQLATTTQQQIAAVFSEVVRLPREAKATVLPCKLRQGALQKGALIWEKKDKGTFTKVSGSKYTITSYSEKIHGLNYYVSALDIKNLELSDYTTYRCRLEDENNDFAEVKLQIYSFTEFVPDRPPETALECCSKEVTRPHCQSACSGTTGITKDVKPGAFLPQFRCFNEFNSLMKCTLQNLNNVGCCIKQQIPYHCLGMCDSRFMLGNIFFSDCVNFVNKVLVCQEDRMKDLPYAVSSLKVMSENDSTSLEWAPSDDAEVYHIYHRLRKGPWRSGATTQTKTIVGPTDEVALISVNKFGYASTNRMFLVENQWSNTVIV